MTTEYLPDGGAVVTLDDGMDWTALDVFTWAAYRELRRYNGGNISRIQFPRAEWSHDWIQWPPPYNLSTALGEIATDVLCIHREGSDDEAQANSSRTLARKVMARNGEDARGLAEALAVDLERDRLARMDYENAKEEVHAALRAGHLQVWARKAHGPSKPNCNADHEPLSAGVFTLQPREVNEGGWIGPSRGYDGPWWDEARFKPEGVLALWPVGEGIGIFANQPVPFPDNERIAPWVAASWRAFGTLDAPGHITSRRSFDQGAVRLPSETRAEHVTRVEEHRQFDAAERELMGLLASGQLKAEGKPPTSRNGKQLHEPSREPVPIPASTFRNPRLAFNCAYELIDSLPFLERHFGSHGLRGSDADPGFPLYHEVMIEAVGLRKAWQADADTEVAAAPEPPIYSTGLAGRPSSKFLVQCEMRRRHAAGELASGIGAEAKVLAEWLRGAHPQAPPSTPKTVANSLRTEYRELVRTPKLS